VLRADGRIKVVQGPASRLRQRQPLGPAFDLLVIDQLFFDGTSQKQGYVKHLVPPEFIHVKHTVLPVLSRLPPAIMVVLPRLHVEKHRIFNPGPPADEVTPG